MKDEMKVIILSVCLCVFFMFGFTSVSSLSQKTFYVYQVGIYKDESNRDNKLKELKEKDIEGMYYEKNDQYYVLSLITENKDEIEKHSLEMKGIIKEYKVSSSLNKNEFYKSLQGDSYD